MNNTKTMQIIKYVIYVLVLFLLYILQTVPGLFAIGGIKPVLLVPAAIAIAMLEGEFVGGIYGVIAGLLLDMGSSLLFGFNGFCIGACSIAVGLTVIYLMRCNLSSCILFSFVTLLIRGSLDYLFSFGMWGYENVWRIFVQVTLPCVLYSTLVSPLIFWLIRGIYRRFGVSARH